MTKPTRHPTTTDVLIRNRADTLKTKGLNRHRIIPRVVQPPSSSGRSAVSGQEVGNSGLALKTAGDTMVGPIAFSPKIALIDSDDPLNHEIDISEEGDQAYTSYIYVGFSSPSEIRTILGASFDGQWLILQSTDPVGLTLNNGSEADGGNIITQTGADITLGLGEIAQLIFDPSAVADPGVNGAWRIMSGGGGTSGSGGNAKTGSMATTTGNTQSVATATQVTLDVFDIVRIEDGVTVNTTTNILTIQETGRYLFGASINVFTDTNNTNVNFQLFKNGIGIPDATSLFIRGTADSDSLYPTAPLDFNVADEVEIRISHDENGTVEFTFEECIFYLIKQDTGGSGGGYETILDEGVTLPQQSTFNFIGSAVNAVDNPGQSRTDVTITAGGTSLPVIDTTPIVFGSGDPTKQLRFEIDGFTTATTRVMTIPDASTIVAGLGIVSQIWTGGNTFVGTTNVRTGTFKIQNTADPTKELDFALGGATTGKIMSIVSNHSDDRFVTLPDASVTLAGLEVVSQTWSGTNIFVGTTEIHGLDMNTFDIFDIDQLTFQSSQGTLFSLNVGFGALGNGGFRGNILNGGQFQWSEENILLMKLTEAASVTSLDVTGILGARITFEETTGGAIGDIIQGTATMQYTTPLTHEFLAGVEPILTIDSSGLAMQGTNFILTPQIGFSILGNIIEDDAGGMIFKTVPGDSFNWADGTNIFGLLDIDGLFLNDMFIQLDSISPQPTTSGLEVGKIFMDGTNSNHLSVVRDTTVVDLEAGGGAASLDGIQDVHINTVHETANFDHQMWHCNVKTGVVNGTDAAQIYTEPSTEIIFYVPVYVGITCTIERIGIDIGTVNANDISTALYANATNGQNYPTTRLTGSVNGIVNTTGIYSQFHNFTLPGPGLYWLAVWFDNGVASTMSFARPEACNNVGWATTNDNNGAMVPVVFYFEAGHTSNVLPATADQEMSFISTITVTPIIFGKFTPA